MNKIEIDQKCNACSGTGLYSGMGESPECAVVCHTCKGTGCFRFIHEWENFTGRVLHPKIKHVYQTNPGIWVGEGHGYKFSDFGGMSYADWNSGKQFILGMENRRSTCPAWWYQSADYTKKPEWEECIIIGSFSKCSRFPHKYDCWTKFDNEQLPHTQARPSPNTS